MATPMSSIPADPVAANLVWVGAAFYQARGHLEQAVSAECIGTGR